MLYFNELRIENKHLIIDVEVDPEYKAKGCWIESISLSTHKDSTEYPIWEATEGSTKTRVRLILDSKCQEESSIDVHDVGGATLKDLLYITVIAHVPTEILAEIPCGCCDPTILKGTVVDMEPFYNQAMQFIKELGDACELPRNFIDYILKFKGLELSIQTGNYAQANELFANYFNRDKKAFTNVGGCGCGNS